MDLAGFAGMMAAQLGRPPVPVRQQLDTLKKLGIKLSEEEERRFLAEPGRYESPAYTGILARLGRDSDQVLAFDAEVARVETMYRDLFARLLRLTGGELDLTDVDESGEEADLEGPGGVWRIAFRLNGNPYQCEADFLGNWLDPNVIGMLNGALEKEGVKKRFLLLDDINVQEQVVFFRTPQWGRFLTAGTQLRVREK